jgi:hypothetical protein
MRILKNKIVSVFILLMALLVTTPTVFAQTTRNETRNRTTEYRNRPPVYQMRSRNRMRRIVRQNWILRLINRLQRRHIRQLHKRMQRQAHRYWMRNHHNGNNWHNNYWNRP